MAAFNEKLLSLRSFFLNRSPTNIPPSHPPPPPRGVTDQVVPQGFGRGTLPPGANIALPPGPPDEFGMAMGMAVAATVRAQAGEAVALNNAAAHSAVTEARAGQYVAQAGAEAEARALRAEAGGHVREAQAAANAAVVQAEANATNRETEAAAGARLAEMQAEVHRARDAENATKALYDARAEQIREQALAAVAHAEVKAELDRAREALRNQAAQQQAPAAPTPTFAVPTPTFAAPAHPSAAVADELERLRAELAHARGNGQTLRAGAGGLRHAPGDAAHAPAPTARVYAASAAGSSSSSRSNSIGVRGALCPLDVDDWWHADDATLGLVHLHQLRRYDALVESRTGGVRRAQAHEATHHLRQLGKILHALPSLSCMEDFEDLLKDLVKSTFVRMEALQEGVVEGSWEAATALERTYFSAPAVPNYLQAARKKADSVRRPEKEKEGSRRGGRGSRKEKQKEGTPNVQPAASRK